MYHLAGKLVRHLKDRSSNLEIDERDVLCVEVGSTFYSCYEKYYQYFRFEPLNVSDNKRLNYFITLPQTCSTYKVYVGNIEHLDCTLLCALNSKSQNASVLILFE